jgi:hypothetical protein
MSVQRAAARLLHATAPAECRRAPPEEAYNYEAEVWCENQLMGFTVLHEGRLHLRIDPRADGAPWLADVDGLADALTEARERLAAY